MKQPFAFLASLRESVLSICLKSIERMQFTQRRQERKELHISFILLQRAMIEKRLESNAIAPHTAFLDPLTINHLKNN